MYKLYVYITSITKNSKHLKLSRDRLPTKEQLYSVWNTHKQQKKPKENGVIPPNV